jgi:hypothetical protein
MPEDPASTGEPKRKEVVEPSASTRTASLQSGEHGNRLHSNGRELLELIESSVLWGGVGLILGVAAASFSQKYIFVIGYLLVLIAVLKHPLFTRHGPMVKFVGKILLCLFFAAILYGFYKITPKPPEPLTADQFVDKFAQRYPWMISKPATNPNPVNEQATKPSPAPFQRIPRPSIGSNSDHNSSTSNVDLLADSIKATDHCWSFINTSIKRSRAMNMELKEDKTLPTLTPADQQRFIQWKIKIRDQEDDKTYALIKDELLNVRKRLAPEVLDKVEPSADTAYSDESQAHVACHELYDMTEAYIAKLFEQSKIDAKKRDESQTSLQKTRMPKTK